MKYEIALKEFCGLQGPTKKEISQLYDLVSNGDENTMVFPLEFRSKHYDMAAIGFITIEAATRLGGEDYEYFIDSHLYKYILSIIDDDNRNMNRKDYEIKPLNGNNEEKGRIYLEMVDV